MAILPTNFKDDILDTSVNARRKYRMHENADGTVEFEDVTEYSQVGSEFGAGQINYINEEVNKKFDKNMVVRDLNTIGAMTEEGYVPDALALKEVNDSLGDISKWKYVGQCIVDSSSLQLPSEWNELWCLCGDANFTGIVSLFILKDSLGDSSTTITNGTSTQGANASTHVMIEVSKTQVSYMRYRYNSASNTNGAMCKVYYR